MLDSNLVEIILQKSFGAVCCGILSSTLLLLPPFVPASHATKGVPFYATPLDGAIICRQSPVCVAEEEEEEAEEESRRSSDDCVSWRIASIFFSKLFFAEY